jgi:hypothetical protein
MIRRGLAAAIISATVDSERAAAAEFLFSSAGGEKAIAQSPTRRANSKRPHPSSGSGLVVGRTNRSVYFLSFFSFVSFAQVWQSILAFLASTQHLLSHSLFAAFAFAQHSDMSLAAIVGTVRRESAHALARRNLVIFIQPLSHDKLEEENEIFARLQSDDLLIDCWKLEPVTPGVAQRIIYILSDHSPHGSRCRVFANYKVPASSCSK